jgi:hypothetical protein
MQDSEALDVVCRNLKITNPSGIFMPLHRIVASLEQERHITRQVKYVAADGPC